MKAVLITALLAPTAALSLSTGGLGSQKLDRAKFLKGVSSLALAAPFAANALSNDLSLNEIVAGQAVAPNKLDVNNSPVADYMKFPGMCMLRCSFKRS